MSRILLMTSAEKGHLNPAVAVAESLREHGHEVGWLCVPEPPPQLSGLGVEVLALPPVETPPLVTGGAELAALVRDAPALRAWIRGLLLDAVPAQVDPVRAVMRAWRPDVAALDGMLYAGAIAAQAEGVRWAGVSSALTLLEPAGFDSELLRTVRALGADRAALFASYGLAPSFRTCECLSPEANVIFSTAALVGNDAPLPPRTHLVGPSLPAGMRGDETAFPWGAIDDRRPLVFVSFGSQISWQPALFRTIAEAAAPLHVQLVLSAGALADGDALRDLPGRVVAVPYAPQLAVLDRAAALVSHGGANSVMEALSRGVPMLLLPVCNDQPLQAWFVSRAGAGRVLDPAKLDVDACRSALAALLADGGPRQAAARIRDDYARHAGGPGAARVLEALLA